MVANTLVGPQQLIDYEYDWRGRRIGKKVWNNTTRTGNPTMNRRFLYHGWNLIAELDGNNSNTLVRSYVWGLDVSGSLQGAGGVGGLLMVKDATQGTHFVAYDLNGNVAGLVSASYGTNTARYEYGPFGEVIRATGPMAKANPFRWSTQYTDDETDLVMYLHRPYNPSTGRFLCKDPIGEQGGLNLYAFVRNSPVNFIDPFGLEPSQLDQANAQFNAAILAWLSGEGGGRYYGPNDPWTKELAKMPVYSRMRNWIRDAAKKACASGTTDQLLNRPLKWDYSADDDPWYTPIRDVFTYIFGTGLKSAGSTDGNFTITSLSCCPAEVCFDMDVMTTLRLGSATRIPGTDISILPDMPSGMIPFTPINLKIPFEDYQLRWHWSECPQFSF